MSQTKSSYATPAQPTNSNADPVDDIISINHRAVGQAIDTFRREYWGGQRSPKVLLLSPHIEDWQFLTRKIPDARFFVSNIDTWDLNYSSPSDNFYFDLIIVSHVFHYSPDPLAYGFRL